MPSGTLRPILILDFGSQVTQLIARRYRELGYYTEIFPFSVEFEKLKERQPLGIVLSGGPNSVYEDGAPIREVKELEGLCPLLGICYGMQLITHQLGGIVSKSDNREYGLNSVTWKDPMGNVPTTQKVWMSHGDVVKVPPTGLKIVATSEGGHPAAIKGSRIWAVQFHPEVTHTEKGSEILLGFANLCGAKPNWSLPNIAEHLQTKLRGQVKPDEHILVGLSGGVDSSVVASLLTRVFGKEKVHCVFVNNGLLRQNEYMEVLLQYQAMGLNIRGVDATAEFMMALKGLIDPEAKRKAIGKTFIDVFEKSIPKGIEVKWLAQGTLYPDVIESVSAKGGPSHVIKSHHNVGGLPEKMRMGLVEPLRELFKDEVREIGRQLGLPEDILGRHPFPGPGLAIRILGEVTPESLQAVREADHIFISALKEKKLYHKIWQAFCVLTESKTVGVQGDGRTYSKVLALRAVTSSDGMTADWYPFDYEFLRDVSNQITNKVAGINRVVLDITSKPPATIEWE